MARVLCTADDLARIRFCTAPSPLMEAGLALADLRRRAAAGNDRLPAWCRAFPDSARPLLDLVPARGFGPQFLDPLAADLDEALSMVLATPRRLIRADLAASWQTRPARRRTPPLWLRTLADGDRDSLSVVVRALRDFHAACLAPQWNQVRARFTADLDTRLPVLAAEGFTGLFDTLHPQLRWQDGALVKPGPTREFSLGGHGLQLMPSSFWIGPPVFAIRPAITGGNALIYPARPVPPADPADSGAVPAHTGTAAEHLAELLGRTRAATLHALRQPRTTTDLAGRLAISLASASEHTKTLRDAHLVHTTRHGRSVRHSLTVLGHRLLDPTAPDADTHEPGSASGNH